MKLTLEIVHDYSESDDVSVYSLSDSSADGGNEDDLLEDAISIFMLVLQRAGWLRDDIYEVMHDMVADCGEKIPPGAFKIEDVGAP